MFLESAKLLPPNGRAQPPAGAPAEAGRLERVLARFLFNMLSHYLSPDVQIYKV